MGRARTIYGVEKFLEEDKEAEDVACFCDVWVCAEEVEEDGGVVQPERQVHDVVGLVLRVANNVSEFGGCAATLPLRWQQGAATAKSVCVRT